MEMIVGCVSREGCVASTHQMGRVVCAVSGLRGMRPAWSPNSCCSLNETSDINSGYCAPVRPPFTAVLRPFRLLIGTGEIIDYISWRGDSEGRWVSTVGPLRFYILWVVRSGVTVYLISLPYGSLVLSGKPSLFRRWFCMQLLFGAFNATANFWTLCFYQILF